jgi:sialate O-acetylesterase
MIRSTRPFVLAVAVLCLSGLSVRADVKLAPIFGDHMVLQRDMKVPVWGKAAPGEEVTVAFLDQKKITKADEDGKWLVKLDELKAGGPYELTVQGKNTVTLKDVLVGEVWVCSGQSNMQWQLSGTENAAEVIKVSDNPKLRLNGGGGWAVSSPKTSGKFSGTGYYFGRDLQKALGVPVGLINRSVGGTSARLWTSQAAIKGSPELKPFAAAILKEDKKGNVTAGRLYEGMIRPLIPLAIRGVIWYQGESDAGRPAEYKELFRTLIRSWRSDWGQGDFPFLFVELGAIGPAPKGANGPVGWGPIREAQAAALALPKTAMAGFIDSDSDLHPRKKHLAGERLALAARAIAYGEKLEYAGPMFESMKVEGDKVVVRFRHTGGGLVVKGDALKGFAVAGPDGKYAWADAKIESDTVVLSSKEVVRPVAVRYGWASNPQCNLYNREGLPAVPFRAGEGASGKK